MDLLLSQESAQAARAFARAASLAPRSPLAEEFWYWRGVALAQSGVTTEARAVFEQFLARFPGSARAGEASVMAGWLLLEEGETDGAAARFRAGVDDRSARVRSSARGGLQAIARTRGKN
jgi:TolA-binding protein